MLRTRYFILDVLSFLLRQKLQVTNFHLGSNMVVFAATIKDFTFSPERQLRENACKLIINCMGCHETDVIPKVNGLCFKHREPETTYKYNNVFWEEGLSCWNILIGKFDSVRTVEPTGDTWNSLRRLKLAPHFFVCVSANHNVHALLKCYTQFTPRWREN